MQNPGSPRRPWATAILALLLLAAVARCYWRSPIKEKNWRLWDFASIYASARAWVHGTNPYDPENAEKNWIESGGQRAMHGVEFTKVQLPIVPPTTYTVLSPMTAVSAHWAMRLWLCGELAMIVLEIVLLARLAGWGWRDWRTLALAAGVFAFAPVTYSWVSGQTSIPVLFGATLALCLAARKHDTAAGVLLGIVAAIKPPLVGPFILYFLLMDRRRVVVWAVVSAAIIGAISLLQLQIHHVPWLSEWRANIQFAHGPNSTNDFGKGNPLRFDLVCLQLLISQMTDNRNAVNLTAIAITAALCVAYLVALIRRGRRQDLLLAVGAAAALGLLPVYHRCTDAIVLLIPMAWALSAIGQPTLADAGRQRTGGFLPWIALVLVAAYFLPEGFGDDLASTRFGLALPARIRDLVVIPLHVWALLFLCITLIAAMANGERKVENTCP